MTRIPLKCLYNVNYSQAVSYDCGLFAIGNNDGKIFLFDIQKFLTTRSQGLNEKLKELHHCFKAHDDSVFSLVSVPSFCVSGSSGLISGWQWEDLKKKNGSKPAWDITFECDRSNFGVPEVNALSYDTEKNILYAACGDWQTRVFDLETGKLIQSLKGHDNYVHDVAISVNHIATCGEDGLVLIFDLRSGGTARFRLRPHTLSSLARPSVGKFISSLDIENDWLVCGGGPRAGVFHLRSTALTTVLPPPDVPFYVVKFTHQIDGGNKGGIILAGENPNVYICSINGDVTAEIPSSSPCIYSVNIIDNPFLMTLCGMGPKVDVCYNMNYRDHSVSIFENLS